ncbi:hypothetical protein [Streptomyces soliscabiei]|uniref:hypothetical protein n=1 Tax=Streptomyces soliscabiei TaxID=588897 RepID=UPI0029A3196C|nr:hypothetical protein [Streptomyces sp. NY05-11A]MDX2679266.1 hypothetical protein [Streptomyces sp. NY05-11A]
MSDKTTAKTLLRVLQAAEQLQDRITELSALYNTRTEIFVGLHHISLMAHPETAVGYGEAMAQDAADIIGADLQPQIEQDLWAHWRGEGQHNGHTIRIHASIPPRSTEEVL